MVQYNFREPLQVNLSRIWIGHDLASQLMQWEAVDLPGPSVHVDAYYNQANFGILEQSSEYLHIRRQMLICVSVGGSHLVIQSIPIPAL